MATLVLTTIGTALGGPLGGAIGALIGQSVDSRLLAPGGRSGPRLSDLRIQTSHYGTAIARLFGRMRVAGTVIWATDLSERRTRTSNGKGRGSTTTYSYAASFAVALSSRPIRGIGRIWAEGNLLRGSDGRFTSTTQFRVHHGDEDQPVDPLIAAAEGVEACPAYRGIAYVVFEEMDLAPFGNRIPSLSFEVIADDEPPTLGMVLADAIPGATIADDGPTVAGFAQLASSRRGAVQLLSPLLPVRRRPGEGWIIGAITAGDQPAVPLGPAVLTHDGQRSQTLIAPAVHRPARISVRHYDPARDFMSSVQTARLSGATGPDEVVDFPIASDADTTKRIAATLARRAHGSGHRRDRPSGLAALAAPVGSLAALADGQVALVAERQIVDGHVAVLLDQPDVPGPTAVILGDGGRGVLSPDLAIGDGFGFIFDLPRWEGLNLSEGATAGTFTGGPVVIAAGTGRGWRSGTVEIVTSAAAEAAALGRIGSSAVVGQVSALSSATQSTLIDRRGWIDVVLLRSDMVLSNAGPFDLLAGRNMAMAGEELIQFGQAEPLGGAQWRLTQLLRGRIGTESAMATLAPGAPFALLDGATPLPVPATIGLLPVTTAAEILLAGPGSDTALSLAMPASGRSRLPLSPVHLRHSWLADGGLAVAWVRRSHAGYGWPDGADAPLDEGVERYRLLISAGASVISVETQSPAVTLTVAQVAELRTGADQAAMAVSQLGARGNSLAAVLTIAL